VRVRPLFLLLTCLGLPPAAAFAAEEDIRGFVSVEPFEVRLEALVRVRAYREAWQIGGSTVAPEDNAAVLENVATLLESGVTVRRDGSPLEFTEQSMRFVRPDPERGYVTDERESIPLEEALVGVTFSSEARGVEALEIEWRWFAPRQERLVLEIASRGRPSARYVTPEDPAVSWELSGVGEMPERVDVAPVEREERSPYRFLAVVGFALLVWAAVTVTRRKQHSPAWVGWLIVGGIALVFVGLRVKEERARHPGNGGSREVVYALLRNIYHAFDFRDESTIYDVLAKSVTGPLLEEVYLEVRGSLELENKGGPRVRICEIALRECEPEGSEVVEDGRFRVRADWATIGEVTHWGHTHERTNRYEARMTLEAGEERWKVAELDLLEEERMQKVTRQEAKPEES